MGKSFKRNKYDDFDDNDNRNRRRDFQNARRDKQNLLKTWNENPDYYEEEEGYPGR